MYLDFFKVSLTVLEELLLETTSKHCDQMQFYQTNSKTVRLLF